MNVKKGATMSLWLGAANSLIALGSAVFGVLALIRPEALKGRGNKGGTLVGCGGASVRGGVGGHGGADAGLRSGAGGFASPTADSGPSAWRRTLSWALCVCLAHFDSVYGYHSSCDIRLNECDRCEGSCNLFRGP